MARLKLLLPLVFCGLVTACSDVSNADRDTEVPSVIPENIPATPSEIMILETALPIHETFNVSGPNGGLAFFNTSYKALATPASHLLSSGITQTDTLPSFYYPTCCFFDTLPDDHPTNPGAQRRPPLEDPAVYASDMDFRLKVAANKMAMSNARFTIGQILSDLTPENAIDRKINTTNGAIAELGSWGELDLTSPYRLSFCLVANGISGSGNSNLEVFVDNNSGGNQAHSIHGALSLLLRTPTVGGPVPLAPGNRIVVEVPGLVRQINNSGAQVGEILGVASTLQVGRSRSFFQLRVSSGGYVVMRDLVIERQSDRSVTQLVTDLPCTADATFFSPPSPRDEREIAGLAGTQFAGLPLAVDATVGEAEFFAQLGGAADAGTTTGNFLAISDDEFDNFYREVGSPTRIFVDGTNNAVRFGNALWTMGLRQGAQDDGVTVNGDIDLTQPYRITAEILDLPDVAGYRLQVQIDNNSGTGSASVHGSASRIANLIAGDGLSTGTLVINVPGEITMNGVQLTSINGVAVGDPDFAVPNLIGTATSFITFRCPSECGNATDANTGGISLGDIEIEYQ